MLRGKSAGEIASLLDEIEIEGLFARIGDAKTALAAQFTVGETLGGTPASSGNAPASAPASPAWPPGVFKDHEMKCDHGDRKYYAAPSGEYHAAFCTRAKGDPEQCRPIYKKIK